MIDPVTAISVATSAFNTIKRMVAAGREVEDTLGQIGKWYGAVSDLNECQKQAENPPLFKKIVAGQSRAGGYAALCSPKEDKAAREGAERASNVHLRPYRVQRAGRAA